MKNKFLSLTEKGRWLIATLTLIFTLGIGQMWADDYTFATGTFASDKLSATVDNQTFTFSFAHGGGGSNSYADGQGSKYIKIGSGKTMTITFPNGFVASNLNIKGYTNKDNKTNGEISEVAGVAQSGKTFPARNTGNVSEYDFSISSTATSITFKTKGSTEQSCLLITITGTPPACTQPAIAWNVEPAGGEVGDDDFDASVTTTPENHAVTWSSSITSAATVNNGTIHYVAPGLPTIQASLTYTGEDYCNITVSTTKTILVPITTDATGTNDKYWYYTTEVPSGSSDNGLNYSGTKSGSGLYGTKLNDGGYAWFAKPAVAGTLRVGAFRADGQGEDYEVNVYACNNEGTKGDALGTLSTPHIGGVSTPMDIAADVAGIRIERKTSKEGVLYFVEFKAAAETAVCPSGLSISGTAAYDEGETISLEAALTAGNGEISYKWYKGSIAAGNEIGTGATFTKENCVPGDAGNYYCVAIKDGCDNAESNAYAVTVTPAVDCSSLAGTIYKFQIKTSGLTNGNLSESGTFDVTTSNYLASISGGTLQGYNENNKMTVYGNSSLQLSDNSKSYFIAELDCPLQAGDTIKSIVTGNTALVSKASSKTEDVKLQTSSNATTYNKVVIPTTNNLVDETKVYIWKGGGNCQMRYFEVIRPAKYAVTYTAGDGSVKEGQSLPTQAATVEGGKFNTALGTALEKSGYDFAGWQWTDDESNTHNIAANTEFTMPAYPVTFVAQWTLHVDKYTVKYMDGEDLLDSEEVTVGEHPAGITNPTKALYTFVNWKNGDDVVNPTELDGTADQVITLQAQWNKVYAADGTVNFADDNNSGALADFLPAGYACGNLDGSKNSVWGEESEGDAYFGYKLRHSGAYVELRVVANKRVTFTFGNYAQAGTIKVGEAAAETCTLTDSKYVVDTDAEAVIRFTTTSDGTVTLKSIIIGEIPALDDDATLSDLKVGGVTVAGFSANTHTYYYELPYGTAVGDIPAISATANSTKALQVAIQQAVWADAPYNCYRAQANVQAQDESWGYYDVRFYFAPKYGVELIKTTHTGEHTADKAGYWKDDVTIDKNTQGGGKLGSEDHYFGLTLGNEKTFKAGDLVVIKASNISSTVELFDTKTFASKADSLNYLNKGNFDSHSKMYTFTLTADADKLYLYRTKTAGSSMNPTVDYIAVYRQMDPFIESFKIGEVAGTISGTNIAIELPYNTSLSGVAATVEAYANGGATVTAPTPLAYDTPLGYKVSSAYAEDGDVDYTVTITEAEHYEAKIGETGYATLVAAVEAAQDGDVIVLQEDVTNGAGVMLTKTDAKEITIDFGGYTYTAVSPAVGSAGTQNQAFHLEKGNTVTLKNGTITSSGSEIKMLIQNYCDLTLENIILDGSNLEGSHRYVLSNNCGDVVIGSGTEITAKPGDVAFDVCATNYYPEGVTVTVKEGATISGIVEYDVWGTKPANNQATLAIEGGEFDITWNVESALAEDAKENLNVSAGSFSEEVPVEYCADGYIPTPQDPITNKYTVKEGWKVTFVDGDDEEIVPVDKNTPVAEKAMSGKIGYTFDGWFNGADLYDFAANVTADLTLNAKWTAFAGCADLWPATSGAALNVGDNVDLQTGSAGGSIAVVGMKTAGSSIVYNADGLYFNGGSADIISVTLNNDMTVGTKISVILKSGNTGQRGLTLLNATGGSVAGGTTLGWDDATIGAVETFSYTVTASDGLDGTNVFRLKRSNSVYLQSVRVESCGAAIVYHNVTSEVNIAGKGTVTLGASTVREGYTTTATYSDIDPLYEFVSWSVSGAGASVENATANPATITVGTEDAVVTLNLQLIPVKFTVNYYDGTTPMGTEEVAVNENPTASEINTNKRHFSFQGWSDTNGGSVVDLNTITSDVAATIDLYAVYAPVACPTEGIVFSMEFDNTKAPESTVKVAKNGGSIDLANYATLVGGNAAINNTETSDKDAISTDGKFKLTATKEVMKIELECAIATGDVIRIPDNNAKYVLSTSNAKTGTYQAQTSSQHDFEATAAWNGVDDLYILYDGSSLNFTKVYVLRPYTVSFDLQGHGDAIDAQKLVEGKKVEEPTAPTADGWDFGGWYKEAACTNAWDFDNDVVDGTMSLFAKWTEHVTNDATLKSLKYGTTAITLVDGTYTYEVELAAAVAAVPALTAETNAALATKLITDATEFVAGEATSTVLVTAEDGATQLLYTVNFTKEAALPQVNVTEATVWNFATAVAGSSSMENLTDVVLANVPGITNDATFNSQALKGTFNKMPGNYFQGSKLNFTTEVPGKLTITFRGTNNNARHLQVCVGDGEAVVADWNYQGSGESAQQEKTVFVPAGKVTLKAFEGETAQNARIYNMIFDATPDYERSVSNNIGTLCVDHNVPAGQYLGATFYQIASRNEQYNDKIDFEEVLPNEELKAGEPYIFQSTTGRIDLFYGETVADDPVAVRGMIGNYAASTLAINEDNQHTILYIAENKIWSCENIVGSTLKLNPNRAYINMELVPTYAEYQEAQTSNPAPRRRVTLGKNAEQVVTGVENLNASEQPVKLLINGQIFILRGEKMFDATGRLVK